MTLGPLALLLAGTEGIDLNKPLQLVAETTRSGVDLTVVGNSPSECVVEYELSVESGKPGNHNRSTQRGKAHLLAGRETVIVKSSLGMAAADAWDARLVVRACDGLSYEVTQNSKAP